MEELEKGVVLTNIQDRLIKLENELWTIHLTLTVGLVFIIPLLGAIALNLAKIVNFLAQNLPSK